MDSSINDFFSRPCQQYEQYKHRLHCAGLYETFQGEPAPNFDDPFGPLFRCPCELGLDGVYRGACGYLEEFTIQEVLTIGEILNSVVEAELRAFRLANNLPSAKLERGGPLSIDAFLMYSDFCQETLSSGKVVARQHLWAVRAIQLVRESIQRLNIPPFRGREDAPDKSRPGDFSVRAKYLRAIPRAQGNTSEAGRLAVQACEAVLAAFGELVGTHRMGQQKIELEKVQCRMKGLALRNQAKSEVMARAQVIASELWQADTTCKVRITEMADQVYRLLVAEGFTEYLPDSFERVKDWIKPTAPDYARKGGRRRNTAERIG